MRTNQYAFIVVFQIVFLATMMAVGIRVVSSMSTELGSTTTSNFGEDPQPQPGLDSLREHLER